MKKLFPCIIGLALILFTGCTSVIKVPPYPSAAAWDTSVKALGPVTADSGLWPLSLHSSPPEQTYYSALKSKAASQYGVGENEVVLSEVTVSIGAELDGTIRDWKATATAGQKKGGAISSAPKPSDALLELKKLLDAGAITPAEFEAKKKVLLEKL